MCAPSRPEFLNFHAVFGKNSNNRLAVHPVSATDDGRIASFGQLAPVLMHLVEFTLGE